MFSSCAQSARHNTGNISSHFRAIFFHKAQNDKRIADFQVACSHLESLHSHDAVSVIVKGVNGGMTADFMDFGSLVC